MQKLKKSTRMLATSLCLLFKIFCRGYLFGCEEAKCCALGRF